MNGTANSSSTTTRLFSSATGEIGPKLSNDAGLSIRLWPNGCVESITHDDVQINLFRGSAFGGSVHRLYLRHHSAAGVQACELVGPAATNELAIGADRFTWCGEYCGLSYYVTLALLADQPVWGWEIEVTNTTDQPKEWDTVLVQDVGLSSQKTIETCEAYVSQYIDHAPIEHPTMGPVLLSRQSQAVNGKFPWLMQGCLEGLEGFTTDGDQFFTSSCKLTQTPALLCAPSLGRERMQYEFSCIALQSRIVSAAPETSDRRTFFAASETDHPAASSDADLARILFADALRETLAEETGLQPIDRKSVSILNAPTLRSADWTQKDTETNLATTLHQSETRDGKFLSAFGPDGQHCITAAKERLLRRQTGHILRTGDAMFPDGHTLSTTLYSAGVFASQLCLGNTNFHKLLSVVRDGLGLVRAGGLRMLVEIDGCWQWLGVPSAFTLGLDSARWDYELDGQRITVTTTATDGDIAISVDTHGRAQRFLILADIDMGSDEHPVSANFDCETASITLRPATETILAKHYPEAQFSLSMDDPNALDIYGGGELLGDAETYGPLPRLVFKTQCVESFNLSLHGSLGGIRRTPSKCDNTAFWQSVIPATDVRCEANPAAGDILQTTMRWFAHNAMIHISAPHGLEQYSGAAWGTRDACQGPMELLSASGDFATMKEVLRKIYAAQYSDCGDWPQWFMFAPYQAICAEESHGDVILWPLKALCDYLETTQDFACLDEPLAMTDRATGDRTAETPALIDHVRLALETIQSRCLAGTSLISYGEGDWNDSLQPAKVELRKTMVSCWTAGLLCQTLTRLTTCFRMAGLESDAADLDTFTAAATDDFHRYAIVDDTISGFLLRDEASGDFDTLLHPSDTRTGIHYRLLPMIRGIISELFTPDQAAHHLALIHEHLLFPDGAHLMDRPVPYSGGTETFFRRAESASCFGREIGLHYVHAHLRYAEALAKLGLADELWDALMVVNPIAINDRLASAGLRQRNAYFSSSDAAFADRYESQAQWDNLRRGEIRVDGGWRIYSSGPGIYLGLIVHRLCGLRRKLGQMIFDPVLTKSLDGLEMSLRHDGRAVTYRFCIRQPGRVTAIDVNGKALEFTPLTNRYRSTGAQASLDDFGRLLKNTDNTVTITIG